MNYSPKTLSRWQQPHELFGRALVDLLLPQGVTFRYCAKNATGNYDQ